MKVHRDWRQIVRQLRANGYRLVPAGKHLTVQNAAGKPVYYLPTSPSDRRAILNCRADLRRIGAI